MKHLLLSLALIISANAWADDEFPIELTCEIGDEIWYFFFDEDKENSWFMPHKANAEHIIERDWKEYKGKKNKFKSYYEITDSIIGFNKTRRINARIFYINRYSLGIRSHHFETSGQCYKGFKEYEKQI